MRMGVYLQRRSNRISIASLAVLIQLMLGFELTGVAQSAEAVAFYEFTRTMQTYKSIIAENTTLVLSTGSDLFKFLKGMTPDADVIPPPRSANNR
jgi:hypothetical protein